VLAALSLATLAALPLAAVVAQGERATGRARVPAPIGSCALARALELTSVDDVPAFADDPELAAVASAGIASRRADVAIAALARVARVPAGETFEAHAEDVLVELERRVVVRHPAEAAELAGRSWASTFRLGADVPVLLGVILALVLYRRSRRAELLFFVYFAAVPCLVGVVDESAYGFARPLALPLLAATLWTLGRNATGGESACPPPALAAGDRSA
jgi:hypothetical protein